MRELLTEGLRAAGYTEHPTMYFARAGRIPLGSATRFSVAAQESRAVKMALTSLRPVRDDVHRARHGRSLLTDPWRPHLDSLAARGLAHVDDQGIILTPAGEVLVEAIINTELDITT